MVRGEERWSDWSGSALEGGLVPEFYTFFLSKNIRIARDRAWDQTLVSRGKGSEFWGSYVEEWQKPPRADPTPPKWEKWMGNRILRIEIGKLVLAPLNFIPFLGLGISAWMKALSTSRGLHNPSFQLKKMTLQQIATYMEERKWDHRAFGFVAALFESIPILGIGMTVSNRIASAMWAHDLEKRQEPFRKGELKPRPPRIITTEQGETIELAPRGTSQLNSSEKAQLGGVEKVAGAWQ
ncbi:hypothetical protein FRC09_001354 [Ceratobasidium sp. 395]|nr:hypothetical protein FRC09_001354 [Ceratobasidium sp. 395]